jgi:ATP-dependent RNA helicase DHX29
LVETTTRKQPKGAKARKAASSQPAQSPAVRKLLSQLQKIASDALFDEWEAETQWPAKRNQIAQDRANKRQNQDGRPEIQEIREQPTVPIEPVVPEVDHSVTAVDSGGSDDEADLLGGMFTAVPNEPATEPSESNNAVPGNVTLRDFGKSSGLTPRRLLEEAIRSRLVDRITFSSSVLMILGTQMRDSRTR